MTTPANPADGTATAGTANPADGTQTTAPAGTTTPADGTQTTAPAGNQALAEALSTDINALVEKARTQERSKLYPEIEELKKTVKEQQALLAKLSATPPAPAAPKKGVAGMDAEELSKLTDSIAAAAESKVSAELKALRDQNEALAQAVKARELSEYRTRLISENAAAIIPELVQGNSKEDLDQSLVLAKQSFARLSERFKSPDTATQATYLPPTPTANTAVPPNGSGEVDVSQMPMDEYIKQRQALLQRTAQAVSRALQSGG